MDEASLRRDFLVPHRRKSQENLFIRIRWISIIVHIWSHRRKTHKMDKHHSPVVLEVLIGVGP